MENTPQVEWKHEDRIIRNELNTNLPAVKLFMYDIKNRENFYQRNHPKNLHPYSESFEKYWSEFEKKCVEGLWVNDEGTWVYMMPKLYYYINYVIIHDKRKGRNKKIQPDLSSVEWVVFTYLMCIDGFSGFEDDERYTCNYVVEKIEKNKNLPKDEQIYIPFFEIDRLPKSVKNKKGEYKKYVDPWEYLTRVYLHDDPLGKPLGQATYNNTLKDGLILGGRGVAKSYCIFSGDFPHEWTFGGIKRMEDIGKANASNIFAAASVNAAPLIKSLEHTKMFLEDQPGSYAFSDPDRPDYGGPFYRMTTGIWQTGNVVKNIVKNKNTKTRLKGPQLFINTLSVDKKNIGAGDRTKRQYIEEFGFLAYAKSVYNANKDSLRIGEDKSGNCIMLGTSGDMGAIQEPKEMFENPQGFEIFGIPNYWKNPNKKIGLFLSCLMAYRDLNDKNGNTNYEKVLEYELNLRAQKEREKDADTVASDITWNPIIPDEMLIPSGFSVLPKLEAQKQIADIESFDWDKKLITYGELVTDSTKPSGVDFVQNYRGEELIIDTMSYDINADLTSVYSFVEHPIDNSPEGLYWVIYDPVRNKGQGTSLNGLIVVKGMITGNPRNFEDNIVATRFWRDYNLEDSYEKVIAIARYYNAKIFPERTVPGFNDFCERKRVTKMLVPEPQSILKSLGFTHKSYVHGFDMNNEKLKFWCLDKLSQFLKQCTDTNEDNLCVKRKINYIFFKGLLNEVKMFNSQGNFDGVSVMLGWMLLRGELEEALSVDGNKEKEENKIPQLIQRSAVRHRVKPSKFNK